MCKSDNIVYESDKNTLFWGVTHYNTGPTCKKVLLAMDTQCKMENIDDIYFRTGLYFWRTPPWCEPYTMHIERHTRKDSYS